MMLCYFESWNGHTAIALRLLMLRHSDSPTLSSKIFSGYTFLGQVTSDGHGFPRPFQLAHVESPSGHWLDGEDVRFLSKKNQLGVSRCASYAREDLNA
ncbi:MAG: hypothetical protein UX89_C0001G0077 [Parcubacteria group bacterium GW2011_GWA2_47_16]|nr:MAG: hypothetical protein UX89_C0001G0077 [Parcubacteria group bacterium GW2011_GWA2_47_16]